MNNFFLIFIFFMILNIVKGSIQECSVDENSKCLLNKYKKLGNNEFCIDKSGYIYKGINNSGICIMIGYNENGVSDLGTRESGSNEVNVGYYLKKENGELVTTINTVGILYYCTSENDCDEVKDSIVQSGYYRNADNYQETYEISIPFIKCREGSNKCEAISILSTNSNDCSTVGVGGIIALKTGITIDYKICLNDEVEGNAVSVSLSNKYFISIDKSNAFGHSNGKYVLINIDNRENILKEVSKIKKYYFTDGNLKVYSKENKGEICDEGTVINEFEITDEENVYYSKK